MHILLYVERANQLKIINYIKEVFIMKTRTFTKLEKELFYGIQNQGYKILDMEIYDLDTSKSYSISFLVEKNGEKSRMNLCITNDLVTQRTETGAIIYFNI